MKIFYSWNILCYLQALVLIIIFKKLPVLQNLALYGAWVPLGCLNRRWFPCSCVGLVWVGTAGFWSPRALDTHGRRACRPLPAAAVLPVLRDVGRTGSQGRGLLFFWVWAGPFVGIAAAAEWLSTCGHGSSGPPAGRRAGGRAGPARPLRAAWRSTTLPWWLSRLGRRVIREGRFPGPRVPWPLCFDRVVCN